MRILFWIIAAAAAAIAVLFALFNRQAVRVDFWPAPVALEMPLFLVVIVTLFIGFVLGAVVTWLGQGRWRRRARERQRRIHHLEHEIVEFRERGGEPPRRSADFRPESDSPAAPAPPALPGGMA